MQPRQLTVHNASIATATVEIKTLTVSGKQVTLAVYRQLQQERLVNEDGTLAGVPWGRVNYCSEWNLNGRNFKCNIDGLNHWHIVWQKGEELCRSLSQSKLSFDVFRPAAGQRFRDSAILEMLKGRTEFFDGRPACVIEDHVPEFKFEAYDGTIVYVGCSELANRVLRVREYGPSHEQRFSQLLVHLEAQVAEYGKSTDELYEDFRADVNKELVRRQRCRESHDSLAQLPQLFIAV
jgi:hypothetical protein